MSEHRKIRVGMVGGGGPANFFGAPHRTAILMDNTAELWCGALRTDPAESVKEGDRLFFTHSYPDFMTMITREKQRRDIHGDPAMDYVTIVTPNDSHFEIARMSLNMGFPVLCEKPLTINLEQAKTLVALTKETGLPFIVAYTYTAFPMVMLAREMVRQGDIGEVRKVEAWYPQGWLADRTEDKAANEGGQQAEWRVDPVRAGASGCGGDIGTHAYEFVRFVAGLTATKVSARLKTFVKYRALDDDFTVFARLNNGGIATISASQVTIGALNDNGFRVIGTKGTIQWSMTDHNCLYVYKGGSAVEVWRTGGQALPKSLDGYTRLPGGHPEGFHEALANLHLTMQRQIRRKNGEDVPDPFPHPDVVDGAAGMAFIAAAVESDANNREWTYVERIKYDPLLK